MFQTEVVQEVKTNILCLVTVSEKVPFEIIWKNIAEMDRPQMTVWNLYVRVCARVRVNMDWTTSDQDKAQWRGFEKMALNFWVTKKYTTL
jgi:hypothetical protein